jgi:hypothetical protein
MPHIDGSASTKDMAPGGVLICYNTSSVEKSCNSSSPLLWLTPLECEVRRD